MLTRQINTELMDRMQRLVSLHPLRDVMNIEGGNVQIDCTNNIFTVGEIEGVIEDVEALTSRLTSAIEENTRARAETENKLRNTEVCVKY